MELIFNELSIFPVSADKFAAREKMKQFAFTLKKSREFKFMRVRVDVNYNEIKLAENYTFLNWFTDKEVPKELRDFIGSSIVYPFIKDEDESIVEKYIESDYFYKMGEDSKTCSGLAAAHLYPSLSISFQSSEEWQKNALFIYVENTTKSEKYQVPNVYSQNCFSINSILEFIETLGIIELQKSDLDPEKKEIRLSEHHGKQELTNFCDKIKKSEYVISMRSTNWGGNKFIRKMYGNGEIEITLVNTERKYALLVQTTGRNYRETKAIADILDEKFS